MTKSAKESGHYQRARAFHALSNRFRAKRFQEVECLIRSVLKVKDPVRILDAGGRAEYWLKLPENLRPHVHLVITNYEEELKLGDAHVSGLKLENIVSDACNMPEFESGSFDIVHSNSVIEHVGSLQRMLMFANEVRRVGNAYYVQTPHFWFPIEPHYAFPFVHWLPDPVRVALFTKVKMGYSSKIPFERALVRADHTRMIDRRMIRNFFPDGRVVNERLLLMTKSVAVVRDYTV